jgi:hypothetical protein
MTLFAPTQAPSEIVMDLTIRPKEGSDQSWFPVHKYAPCERQASRPIVICSKLSIQQSSPIQAWLPIDRRQGYFTRTPGRITAANPMLAPNARRSALLSLDDGFHEHRNTGRPRKNQRATVNLPRPTWYRRLSNVLKSGLIAQYGVHFQLRRYSKHLMQCRRPGLGDILDRKSREY